MESEALTLFKIIAWSTGPVLAVIAGGVAWGWVRAKIVQHDIDITGANKEIKDFKYENKEEHDKILDKLDTVNNFMGRMEQHINNNRRP